MPLIEDGPRALLDGGGQQMHDRPDRPDRGAPGHRRYRPVGAALGHSASINWIHAARQPRRWLPAARG
jgi:hypothetical protein